MPPLTTPDRVSIYGFQPDSKFPPTFDRLARQTAALPNGLAFSSVLVELLSSSSSWEKHLPLTAQPIDAVGIIRPYECDKLVDLLTKGAEVADKWSHVCCTYFAKEDTTRLSAAIAAVAPRLHASEKEEWLRLLGHLERFTAVQMVVVYRW